MKQVRDLGFLPATDNDEMITPATLFQPTLAASTLSRWKTVIFKCHGTPTLPTLHK